jgi:hypothetical protein
MLEGEQDNELSTMSNIFETQVELRGRTLKLNYLYIIRISFIFNFLVATCRLISRLFLSFRDVEL